jgi:peptidoglycan/xylan/chitin deacetylase (PgdA/CDA1 family)
VGYHRVVENFAKTVSGGAIPSLLISTRMLERQIDWLAGRYSIVSLDEMTARFQSGEGCGKFAAITFDDGYSDVYHHAYPLLKRKGIPAAFFVVTDLIGTGRPQVFDRLYSVLQLLQQRRISLASTVSRALEQACACTDAPEKLCSVRNEPFSLMTLVLNSFPQEQVEAAMAMLVKEVGFEEHRLADMKPLSWEMVETMHRGGMTIGSHTKSHLLLTSEALETVRKELIESKQALESRLHSPVYHFAYPDGRFNAATVRAVEQAGYRFGYGICYSRDPNRPLLTIPRKILWERSCVNAFGRLSSAIMNCQAQWIFDPKNRCGHDHTSIQSSDAGISPLAAASKFTSRT